jgi:alkyl sulfatase BDS1-like metallo-beta-lactamase superfamily hydrolase
MTRNQRRKKAYYNKSMISVYAAVAIALHEKHGWGKKRITELLESSRKKIESVEKDTITLEEMLDICEGFKVNIKR